MRYGTPFANAITMLDRSTPSIARTSSTTRCKSAFDVATTRTIMSPGPVMVCASRTSGISLRARSMRR